MDLHVTATAEWDGSQSAGTVGSTPFAPFRPLGSAADQPSPEDLLLAAITSSYALTLSLGLRAAELPHMRIRVQADAIIDGDPPNTRFTRVTLAPEITRADPARREDYETAATAARNDVVGRSVRGGIAYVIGHVVLSA
jgi:organic hydroperoxide reductase OsmC/OhrA